ncbi:hypothetical protein ACJ72_07641, partial [Emergomyces africanus]
SKSTLARDQHEAKSHDPTQPQETHLEVRARFQITLGYGSLPRNVGAKHPKV